jgi:hypothetical protein
MQKVKNGSNMNMMTTPTTMRPSTLTVDIEDVSMMRDIKKAISMVRGVKKVSMPRRKRLTGYEQARLDVEEGRICSYDSLDDFIKEIENG